MTFPYSRNRRAEAMNQLFSRTLLTATLLLAACSSGPRGRVMSNSDEDYVGNRAAGGETFSRLIEGAVQKVLSLRSAALGQGSGKLKVAVLGVENESGEELGDWHAQIYELIDTSINRSERYASISRRYIDAGLRELRFTRDDLFVPAKQRDFARVLEQSTPVDCFMFPKLTRGSTHAGGGVTQRNYLLTLELVDLKTGRTDKVGEQIRKEYQQ